MTDQDCADLAFLALTIWREARGEPEEGKVAVAMSIINRIERPSWWGRDVQSVLFKKWQYSSMTDPKDKQLTTWPIGYDKAWIDCLRIARCALRGLVVNPVPGADSYYDDSIPAPKWATAETLVAKIGRLNFHNLDRDIERG